MPRSKKQQLSLAKTGIEKVRELQAELEQIDPSIAKEADVEVAWDLEKGFQLFASFCGDVARTAAALGIQPVQVLRAADRLGWHKQLENIIELKKSGKPGDVERAISRSLNFVQAHRLRIVLERVIKKFYELPEDELFKLCFTTKTVRDKNGTETETTTLQTKPFSDLSAALEKCHAMLYAALADSVTERAAKKESAVDSDISMGHLHQIIAQAMASADPGSPAAQLLQEQMAESDKSVISVKTEMSE